MKRGDGFSRIESPDALLIAATAATTIIKRASCGGTDAMTYGGVRDAILDAMAPFIGAEPVGPDKLSAGIADDDPHHDGL